MAAQEVLEEPTKIARAEHGGLHQGFFGCGDPAAAVDQLTAALADVTVVHFMDGRARMPAPLEPGSRNNEPLPPKLYRLAVRCGRAIERQLCDASARHVILYIPMLILCRARLDAARQEPLNRR